MKIMFTLFCLWFCTIACMEEKQSNYVFNELNPFGEYWNKISANEQCKLLAKLLPLTDKEKREFVNQERSKALQNFGIDGSEKTDTLSRIYTFMGYPGLMTPHEIRSAYYQALPQTLRAFFENFLSWSQLFQDEAVLIGIKNGRTPDTKRPELLLLDPSDWNNLKNAFIEIGYDIENPSKSTKMLYKTIEAVEKKKREIKN